MKLGYIYTVTSGGYDGDRVRINPSGWSSVVEDKRDKWLKYSSDGESVAMTFVDEGVVFAISHVIGGDRANDNITTWVFVPSKIRISGRELEQVIDTVKEVNRMGTRKVTADLFLHNEILSRDYDERNYPIICSRSRGKELAVRYPTPRYSLYDILSLPYQEYYSKYEYVFLLNQKDDNKRGLDDLSDKALLETICVLPPSAPSVMVAFGAGQISVKFADGRPFLSPLTATKGEHFDLIAEKSGCVPVRFIGKADTDENEIELMACAHEWRRIIAPDELRVIDAVTGRTIDSDVEINILDPEYDPKERSIPENRLESVGVRIRAKDYEVFEATVDLSKGRTIIPLRRPVEKEIYNCHKEDFGDLTVTIEGPGAKSVHPLKGYRRDGQRLIFDVESDRGDLTSAPSNKTQSSKRSKFSWREFCYGIVAGLVLAAMIWCGVTLYDTIFTENNHPKIPEQTAMEPSDAMPQMDENIDAASTIEAAVAYLDSHAVWHRDSLSSYAELNGLFEELNNYEFDKMLGRASHLKNSQQFKKLCDAILSNKDLRRSGPYNTNREDPEITISRYIDKLNRQAVRPSTDTSEGIVGKTARELQKVAGDGEKGSSDAGKDKKEKGGE